MWVCLSHAFRVVWQFVNHDSDFEKTKLKLLDAANLVDKVRPCETLQRKKTYTLSTHFGLTHLSAPAVLQALEHQGGVDRPGGVDQPGLNQRHGQPSQHSGCIPVLEEQAAPQAAQRQRSAHHVSHPTLVRPPDLTHTPPLIPPLYLGTITTNIFRLAFVQLEVIVTGVLCLQGEVVSGHHHRSGTSQSYVLRLPIGRREHGERVKSNHLSVVIQDRLLPQ